jgi:hypothetical protein
MNERQQLWWMLTISIVVLLVFIAVMYGLTHPYTIRFEMDNNTLEAIKSINWTAMGEVNK